MWNLKRMIHTWDPTEGNSHELTPGHYQESRWGNQVFLTPIFFRPSPCLTWARGKKHCHRNWGQGSCTPSLDSKGLLLPHLGLSGRLFPLHHLSSRRLKKFHILCDKGVESTCYSTSVNQYIWVFSLKNKLVHRSDCPKFIVKGPIVTCSTLSTVALGGAVEVQAESGASGPTLKEQEVKWNQMVCQNLKEKISWLIFVTISPHFFQQFWVAGNHFLLQNFCFRDPEK